MSEHTAGEHTAENDAPTYGIEAAARLAALYDTGEAASAALMVAARIAREVAAQAPISPAVPATPDAGDASEGAHDGHAERLNGLLADCPGCATSEGLSEDPLAEVYRLANEIAGASPGTPSLTIRHIAEHILASDWLAARVSAAATKARAEERERIAQAIEALDGPMTGENTTSEYLALAARIARLAPGTAGGDR